MNIGPGKNMTRAGRCRRKMAFSRLPAVLVLLGLLMPGCTAMEGFWPSLSAEDPAGEDALPEPLAEALPPPASGRG